MIWGYHYFRKHPYIVVVPPFTVYMVLIHPFTVTWLDPHEPESTRITTGCRYVRYVVLQCRLKALEKCWGKSQKTPWDGKLPAGLQTMYQQNVFKRLGMGSNGVFVSGWKGTAGWICKGYMSSWILFRFSVVVDRVIKNLKRRRMTIDMQQGSIVIIQALTMYLYVYNHICIDDFIICMYNHVILYTVYRDPQQVFFNTVHRSFSWLVFAIL